MDRQKPKNRQDSQTPNKKFYFNVFLRFLRLWVKAARARIGVKKFYCREGGSFFKSLRSNFFCLKFRVPYLCKAPLENLMR